VPSAPPASRHPTTTPAPTFSSPSPIRPPAPDGDTLTFAAQNDFGRLLIEPGKEVEGETLAIGLFDDVRLGLEQWADLTASTNNIKLRPQQSGYCTWYSKPNGGASDETHILELAAFAGRELKPYGFDYVQIDDKWQDGQRRKGPAKVFERVNPTGPYPSGMKPAATGIRKEGLIPGIWYMPFAGDQEDPWFADKQHWFVKRDDGSVYFTNWGGGSLDLSHPEVQTYIRDLAKRIGRDWGYGLLKLDGLWTGLANAQLYVHNPYKPDDLGQHVVHDPSLTPFQAYRKGFRALREGAGDDVFILGCNVSQNMRSFAAAIGMVDAMRIGPDNGPGWNSLKRGPWHGTNRWFLHGRIWYNDPDPLYVRDSMPIEHARLITSWVALTGTLHASSEWLPGLPDERLELIKRALPAHGLPARPVDVLEQDLARIWTVTDPATGRHVVGLFNWDDQKPTRIECDLTRLDLPAGKSWIGRDFWSGTLLAPFEGKLVADLAPGTCQILSLCESKPHPQILASSRHITQGLTDIENERWNAGTDTLSATTDLVANDPTRLTVATGTTRRTPGALTLSKADQAAGVTANFTQIGSLITLTLTSLDSRKVTWSLPFEKSKPGSQSSAVENLRSTELTFGRAKLAWDPADTLWQLRRDDGPAILLTEPTFTDTSIVAGTTHVYQVTAFGSDKPPTKLEITAPSLPKPGPVPPKPDIHLSDLKPAKLTTGHGKPAINRSCDGNPLTIAGKKYTRGLGLHANSIARYPLKPTYRRFVAIAGLDDEEKPDKGGSVIFAVRITKEDGTTDEVARSPALAWDALTHWHFDIPIPSAAKRIDLLVEDAGDGVRCDHADWANAGFITGKK